MARAASVLKAVAVDSRPAILTKGCISRFDHFDGSQSIFGCDGVLIEE